MSKHKNKPEVEIVNEKPCKLCVHQTSGIIHEYEWQDCRKNWSDKQNGLFYGVIKDTCNNWQRKPK